MNGYKDKLTNNERRYLYSVPLLFLLGFGVFLIRFVITTDVQFDFNGKTGVLYNILGALITGYGLASECTTIHFMLNQIRANKGVVKAVFILLFIPAIFAGIVFAAIMTIPYCISCSKKIDRIHMDNKGYFLKWQKVSLIILSIIDIIFIIAYFIVM